MSNMRFNFLLYMAVSIVIPSNIKFFVQQQTCNESYDDCAERAKHGREQRASLGYAPSVNIDGTPRYDPLNKTIQDGGKTTQYSSVNMHEDRKG